MTLERIRDELTEWRFWVGLAYFGLVAVVVALFVLFNRTAREEASRAAAGRSAAATQVGQCFTAVKNAPVVNGFLDSHEAIIQNSLIANRAALAASPPNDPLKQIRINSIQRLERAQDNLVQLRTLIGQTTPTERKCVALAHSLGVDATRYTHSK